MAHHRAQVEVAMSLPRHEVRDDDAVELLLLCDLRLPGICASTTV